MAVSCQEAHDPQESMRMGVCWSVADPWRERQVAALLGERGVPSVHATIQRGGVPYSPQLAEACHRRQRPVWGC